MRLYEMLKMMKKFNSIKSALIVLAIIFSCIIFILIYNYINSRQQFISENSHQQALSLDEKIVAPAIVDSTKDVTHIVAIQSGVVKNIYGTVGTIVKKGSPLVMLDDTAARNNFIIQENVYHQALNAFKIQEKQLSIAQNRLERAKHIDPRAISKSDLQDRANDVDMNKLQLAQVKLNLSNAKINLENAKHALSQFTIDAPIDGIILQINTHVGEYISGGQWAVLLGDADKVYVRVSIDERDMHRFQKNASAMISGVDDSELKIPLTFLQLDRYIIVPEYLNTRCQEAIYYFKRADYPSVVAGQQFEVTIGPSAKG